MAHDDIDQIAASSRLSVHDPKPTNTLGNPGDRTKMMTHIVENDKMITSGYQNEENTRPIVLSDKNKSHGHSVISQANYQQTKQNDLDRKIVDVRHFNIICYFIDLL